MQICDKIKNNNSDKIFYTRSNQKPKTDELKTEAIIIHMHKRFSNYKL